MLVPGPQPVTTPTPRLRRSATHSSGLQSKVCAAIADDLGLRDLRADDDLVQDHGKDEVDMLSVAMRLEEEFALRERSISEEDLINDSTVRNCVGLVRRALGS